MAKEPWHFERPEYRARILNLLNSGPTPALTLFGPRRIGKTEFLLKDLAPLAKDVKRPYSNDFRQAVGSWLGAVPPSAGSVQAALRKLQRQGHIDTHTGGWALVDAEFAAWIKENDTGQV